MFRLAFLLRWFPPFIWALGMFALSAIPELKSDFSPSWDFVLRKIAHATEYAVLAVLIARAAANGRAHHPHALAVGSFLITLLYAVSDEWHQTTVPGREGAVTDVVIDACGALLGVLAWQRWAARATPKTTA